MKQQKDEVFISVLSKDRKAHVRRKVEALFRFQWREFQFAVTHCQGKVKGDDF
jgi:hypothetical protein